MLTLLDHKVLDSFDVSTAVMLADTMHNLLHQQRFGHLINFSAYLHMEILAALYIWTAKAARLLYAM